MIYKLYKASPEMLKPNAAITINSIPQVSFLFDPSNGDYQAFKTNVLAGAELQDADGNVMTNAKDYVRTLP
jgi:hypothetical protein